MVWKKINIKDDKAFAEDSGKDSFFLPKGNAIGDMMLMIRARNESDHNASDACKAETVLEAIEKIEIRAGDRTFQEFSADIGMAWATYRNGIESYCNLSQTAGGTYAGNFSDGWQEVQIPINFGRFAGDRRYGLPAPLYTGLEMEITYNFSGTDANADNAFDAGAAYHRFDLYADIMSHMQTNSLREMQVIEKKKRRNYTSLATGSDLIDLTRGKRQMRQLLVRAYKTGVVEGALLSDLQLECNGKPVFYDKWRTLQYKNAEECNLEFVRRQLMKANSTTDVYYSTIPDVVPNYTAQATGSEDVYISTTGDQIALATQTGDDAGILEMLSPVIPACVFIDFDKDLTCRDLLSQDLDRFQLKINNAGASGAVEFHEMSVVPA